VRYFCVIRRQKKLRTTACQRGVAATKRLKETATKSTRIHEKSLWIFVLLTVIIFVSCANFRTGYRGGNGVTSNGKVKCLGSQHMTLAVVVDILTALIHSLFPLAPIFGCGVSRAGFCGNSRTGCKAADPWLFQ